MFWEKTEHIKLWESQNCEIKYHTQKKTFSLKNDENVILIKYDYQKMIIKQLTNAIGSEKTSNFRNWSRTNK